MKYPETHSVQELGRIDTAAHTGAVDAVTTHMGYTKQNVTNTEAIMVMLGGAAIQMRTAQSISATVEENAFQQFSISIMDVDSGSVSADNINITGISAVIEKSTGGGAFSAAGLTAIVFGKEAGRVFVDYQFLAAQWTVGDVYKIVVTGIQATVGGDTAYIPAMVWSNLIVEVGDVKATVDAIAVDIGDFSARSYDPSLLQVLGVPDVDGKDLTTLLVTDRLDHATFGLSALNDDADAILADIGDFSARVNNLKSLLAVLGVPDADDNTLYKLVYTDMLAHGTHGLAALDTDLTSINADIGDFSGRTNNLKSILAVLGVPDVDDDTLYKLLITDRLDNAAYGLNGLHTDIGTAISDVGGVQTDTTALLADLGDFSARVQNLKSLLAVLGVPDVDDDTLYKLLVTDRLDNATYGLAAIKNAVTTGSGAPQIAKTTIDLNQGIASYDLFAGTTQDVILESLIIKMPTEAAGGSLTSIAIQTDDVTPSVLIDATDGAVANLTAEAELTWEGKARINTGTKIQLTIAGGAEGAEYITTATAEYRAIVDGGSLA